MIVLALEAATYTGSVALLEDGHVLASAEAAMRGRDEERLMPAMTSLLAEQGVGVERLDAIACGAGPGSFTSLRIAASLAKGLAVSLKLPLYAAPSSLLTVASAVLEHGKYIVTLDAMRGEFFVHEVEVSAGGALESGPMWRGSRHAIEERARALGARLVGPTEAMAVGPSARGFGTLLRLGLANPVDVASWEPDYGRKAEAQVKWEAAHGVSLGPS